jgi:hypothetical protein
MVSWNLDKDAVVDLDSVKIDMPASDYGAPAMPPGLESPPGTAGAPGAAEDPNKAIMDSMKQDQPK